MWTGPLTQTQVHDRHVLFLPLLVGHTGSCLCSPLSFEDVLVWVERREETHGEQVWLHQICQGGSLSRESFLQRAAGKLSKTILLGMQMNPFELHFRYVGVYGCQSPLRFWESCKHDTDSQSPSVVWMLQRCAKISSCSNMATWVERRRWLTHRRPTRTRDFFIQGRSGCKPDDTSTSERDSKTRKINCETAAHYQCCTL